MSSLISIVWFLEFLLGPKFIVFKHLFYLKFLSRVLKEAFVSVQNVMLSEN